jgi:hypothetical protein
VKILGNYKVYLAGVGLIGLAVYQLSQGQADAAVTSFLAGLATLGLRSVDATQQAQIDAK